jgi:hypothetical protein
MDDMEMETLPLTPDIIKELRQTVQACSERGLVVASRWYVLLIHSIFTC